jgi:3-deoxy-D-manno-octulosonic-acid transferase
MKLLVYRILTCLAKPLARPLLSIRAMRGKEHVCPTRRAERLGRPSLPRPDGHIFWFNAVSVGESNSILPLVDFVLEEYPDAHALVTTTTVTGAENMASRLAGRRAIHQFLPLDRRAYVDGFLDYWRPTAGFFADSDFWPNLLMSAHDRNIPLILLNGRVSDRSYARWARHRDVCSRLMRAFVYALAKSEPDAEKLRGMGIASVECVGNLKYGTPPLAYDREKLAELSERSGNRPSWVASVTHKGEEELILRAHAAVRERIRGAMLVIAPRHPSRGHEVWELARKNFETALESARDPVTKSTGVYVSDALGGLGLYYAHSGVAFIGGSLLDTLDGHNPMEAARLGATVLSGRNVASFLETYEILERENAVIMVESEDDLAKQVTALLSDEKKLSDLRRRTLSVAEKEAAVLERAKERLKERLEAIAANQPGR